MQTSLLHAGSQRGVSMIEALVAIVVLAIGVLGIAGLNLVSLRTTQDAGGRAAAATLTMEIAEKLRANGVDGIETGPQNLINFLVANGNSSINSAATPPNCFSATANCSSADQAQHDLITWAKSVNDLSLPEPDRSRQARLPGGTVAVCFDSSPNDGSPGAPACSNTPNSPVVVKIWWTERARNAVDAGGLRFIATSLVL